MSLVLSYLLVRLFQNGLLWLLFNNWLEHGLIDNFLTSTGRVFLLVEGDGLVKVVLAQLSMEFFVFLEIVGYVTGNHYVI